MVEGAGCPPQPGDGGSEGQREPGRFWGWGTQGPGLSVCPLPLPLRALHVSGRSRTAGNPAVPFLSCFTRPGMWLYFVLPTFAFPKGGNERASVPPIYCAS